MTKPNTKLDTELRRGRACVAVLATVLVSACSADVMGPRPTDLGGPRVAGIALSPSSIVMLPTGSFGCGRAIAVNGTGVEGGHVFNCADPSITRAALWASGALVVLPVLSAGASSNVRSIADDGTAVGFSIDSLGVSHPVAWRNRIMTLLPGGSSGSAVSIRNDGVIVGSVIIGGLQVPALWVGSLFVTDDKPAGYKAAVFSSISMGAVAGTALNLVKGVVRGARAFRWTGPGRYQLLDLPVSASSVALGQVNTAGTVVGVTFGDGGKTSVYWPGVSTVPVTIATPSGYVSSDLRTINNSNTIAGSLLDGVTPTGSAPAFYSVSTGQWTKLSSPDPIGAVFGINDLGMFVGSIGSSKPQPVLWQ